MYSISWFLIDLKQYIILFNRLYSNCLEVMFFIFYFDHIFKLKGCLCFLDYSRFIYWAREQTLEKINDKRYFLFT